MERLAAQAAISGDSVHPFASSIKNAVEKVEFVTEFLQLDQTKEEVLERLTQMSESLDTMQTVVKELEDKIQVFALPKAEVLQIDQ
jgi:hypothetical protein